MQGQVLLDTRAIEIATEARTEARAARDDCRGEYLALRGEFLQAFSLFHSKLDQHRAETNTKLDQNRTERRADLRGIYQLSWAAVAGLIMILLTVVGFLFVAVYGSGHNDAVKKVIAALHPILAAEAVVEPD